MGLFDKFTNGAALRVANSSALQQALAGAAGVTTARDGSEPVDAGALGKLGPEGVQALANQLLSTSMPGDSLATDEQLYDQMISGPLGAELYAPESGGVPTTLSADNILAMLPPGSGLSRDQVASLLAGKPQAAASAGVGAVGSAFGPGQTALPTNPYQNGGFAPAGNGTQGQVASPEYIRSLAKQLNMPEAQVSQLFARGAELVSPSGVADAPGVGGLPSGFTRAPPGPNGQQVIQGPDGHYYFGSDAKELSGKAGDDQSTPWHDWAIPTTLVNVATQGGRTVSRIDPDALYKPKFSNLGEIRRDAVDNFRANVGDMREGISEAMPHVKQFGGVVKDSATANGIVAGRGIRESFKGSGAELAQNFRSAKAIATDSATKQAFDAAYKSAVESGLVKASKEGKDGFLRVMSEAARKGSTSIAPQFTAAFEFMQHGGDAVEGTKKFTEAFKKTDFRAFKGVAGESFSTATEISAEALDAATNVGGRSLKAGGHVSRGFVQTIKDAWANRHNLKNARQAYSATTSGKGQAPQLAERPEIKAPPAPEPAAQAKVEVKPDEQMNLFEHQGEAGPEGSKGAGPDGAQHAGAEGTKEGGEAAKGATKQGGKEVLEKSGEEVAKLTAEGGAHVAEHEAEMLLAEKAVEKTTEKVVETGGKDVAKITVGRIGGAFFKDGLGIFAKIFAKVPAAVVPGVSLATSGMTWASYNEACHDGSSDAKKRLLKWAAIVETSGAGAELGCDATGVGIPVGEALGLTSGILGAVLEVSAVFV